MATKKKSRSVSRAEPGDVYKERKPLAERTNGPFDEWEVRDALRTITEAAKLQRNRGLMKEVRAEANRQVKAAEETKKSLSGE